LKKKNQQAKEGIAILRVFNFNYEKAFFAGRKTGHRPIFSCVLAPQTEKRGTMLILTTVADILHV